MKLDFVKLFTRSYLFIRWNIFVELSVRESGASFNRIHMRIFFQADPEWEDLTAVTGWYPQICPCGSAQTYKLACNLRVKSQILV